MQITPWSPFGDDPFKNFEKQFENFFKDMMPTVPTNLVHAPSLNMYQKKNDLMIDIAMPGIDPDKVQVEIDENNVMTIKGSSKKKTEIDDKDYYRKEIRSGTFFRRVQLPSQVKGEKAKAEYEDGVLTVSVPMTTQKKAQTIKVEKKKKLKPGNKK